VDALPHSGDEGVERGDTAWIEKKKNEKSAQSLPADVDAHPAETDPQVTEDIEAGGRVQGHPPYASNVIDCQALRRYRTSRSGQHIFQIRVASTGMGQPMTSAQAWRAAVRTAAASTLAFAVTGCGILGNSSPTDEPLSSISVSSPRLSEGAPLPVGYSCKGRLGSPPLRWSGVPSPQTKSMAVVVDDDNAQVGAAVHWVLYNIDPRTTELGENIGENPPAGARQGPTSDGKVGYSPPCRPDDNYRFTVYALSAKVNLKEGALLSETLQRIADRTIASGRLTAVHIE
jgi:Raf kinase inhibitor-like YbhB/YbcL family protein